MWLRQEPHRRFGVSTQEWIETSIGSVDICDGCCHLSTSRNHYVALQKARGTLVTGDVTLVRVGTTMWLSKKARGYSCDRWCHIRVNRNR